MKFGARARFFLAFSLLVLVYIAAGELFLIPAMDREMMDRLRTDYSVRLDFLSHRAQSLAMDANDTTTWDAFADDMGRLAQARVTVIQEDGRVVGDSEVNSDQLSWVENHRDRPEVMAALTQGTGQGLRYSSTTRIPMMYLASRIPGPPPRIIRISVPLAEIDRIKRKVHVALGVGGAIAIFVAMIFATLATQFLTRRLLDLTKIARRMAAGDLDARARSHARDEIGELSRTLDQFAETLSRSLRDLRDDRDLLGRILESMREGVLVMDGEHRILLANSSLKETLLLDSDVVGRSTIEVIRNADLQALVERALKSENVLSGEIEITGLTPRRMQVHASRLYGEPRALLLVLFDVTEMRRLETIRRDFVANVSHELRTPISSVRSAAETLRMALSHDPKAAGDFLDIIERNGRRLGELVNDLLDLSKIEAKDYRPSAEPLDLPSICEKVIAAFSDRAKTRQIHLQALFPTPAPVPLGDPHAVERILTNLADNALKYCSERSTVTFFAEIQGPKLWVQVQDTGPGIEAKHLPRLFERFYRVDPGRSRDMGGTGLGLSIVKHLVEAMGGEVTVKSEPSRGTTFSFSLPHAQTQTTENPAG